MKRSSNAINVWFLAIGGGISGLGDTVFYTALSFTVLATTHSLLGLSSILIAQAIPRVVLSSFSGVLVDRWNRRATCLISDLARALIVASVLFVKIAHDVISLDVIILVEAAFSQVFMPAQAALIPEVVGDPIHLQRTNSLMQTTGLTGQVLGPVFGTYLLLRLGLKATVIPDAFSYIVSAGMLALVRVPRSMSTTEPETIGPSPTIQALWSQWRGGITYILQARWLWMMLIALVLVLLADGALSPGMVAFVYTVLDRNAVYYGIFQSAGAVASIIGGLAVAALGKRITPSRMLVGALASVGGAYLTLFVIGKVFWVLVVLYGIAALFTAPWLSSLTTIMQQRVPQTLQGRTFGSMGSVQSLALLMGIALMGALSPLIGVRQSLVGAAGLVVVAAGVAAVAVSVNAGNEVIDKTSPHEEGTVG